MSAGAADTACTGSTSPEAALSAFLASLNTPQTLLVAISGGSDSTGLLLTLADLLRRAQSGHRLVAATVDHRLRPASSEEARWVADLCARLGIAHQTLAWTGEKPASGIPAAAREARYRLLAEAAGNMGATAILTGHTLDDQIETVRMRAERAAADNFGLAGMAPATLYDRRHWILRPLLSTRREQIRDALRQRGEAWLDDPSNDDPRYERVRLRQTPVSFDETALNRAADARSSLSAAAAAWLDERAQKRADYLFRISLSPEPSVAPIAGPAARHALSTLAAIAGGKAHRPQAAALDRLTAAIATGADFRLTLSGSLFLRRRDELFCLRERRGVLTLPLPPGLSISWDGRYRFDNRSPHSLIVTPGQAPVEDAGLPGLIRSALAGNYPHMLDSEGRNADSAADVALRMHIPLVDHLLPDFDLPLARAIDRLVGRDQTQSCPI